MDLGIYQNINFLGNLDAEGVAELLSRSHVFISPSLMENSSNSVAEAMIVGTPSVVSLVGGSCSMVKDSDTALCYPPDDPAMLAECIRMLFTDESLSKKISTNAQAVAVKRHNYKSVAKQLYSIYEIVRDNKSESGSLHGSNQSPGALL